MSIHIVLVSPKIPSNTGSIIRLCANTGAQLHLVEPLGFDLEDKKMRRAGLDYHEYAQIKVHKHWQEAKQSLLDAHCQHIVALTTKLSQPFYSFDFTQLSSQHDSTAPCEHANDSDKDTRQTSNTDGLNEALNLALNVAPSVALVFGSETAGLAEDIREDIGADNWLRLPMLPESRSLNLANSVAICLYEVWRQQGFLGDQGQSIGYEELTPYDPK